jgi:hypothetical protein
VVRQSQAARADAGTGAEIEAVAVPGTGDIFSCFFNIFLFRNLGKLIGSVFFGISFIFSCFF